MKGKNQKKQIAKISVFITSIFVILMSVTYALMSMVVTGEKQVVINAGVLDLVLEEENEITISDALPMYDEVGMIQEDVFVFRLVNKTANPTNYVLKLSKIEATNELSTSDVKYYLTKEGVGEPALLSTLPEDGTIDSGTITGNDTIDYTLRLWIDSSVTDQTAITGKSLSYMLNVEVSQESMYAKSEVFDTVAENLGENCKTHDDGTDTFLVGRCSQNYIWYSGKLWRVVLKNNKTGAVKMVTDNEVTAISYNSYGNTSFEDSYVDQWLNQEFLPTLHDLSDYLVLESEWYDTQDSSSTPTRPTGTAIVKTVGLLNAYEYYTTYASSDGLASSGTGYLRNGVYWRLMTPYDNSNLRYVASYGLLTKTGVTSKAGVRPSVNLKSTIQIKSGTGIESDPYILEGDLQEFVNGTTLLNTRYSGEYITFNNELYRIVGVETVEGEQLTKITTVDKPSALSSNVFDSNTETYVNNFAEADIKTDLENYYQEMKTTNEEAYNMIQPNTTWYLGKGTVNYKESICATVDANTSMKDCEEKVTSTTANIGLPRVGEMFTSHITRGSIEDFWTLTPPSSGSAVLYVKYDGMISSILPTNELGARPSMYLKSTVKIASNNTGNGTYEYPYSIELGS